MPVKLYVRNGLTITIKLGDQIREKVCATRWEATKEVKFLRQHGWRKPVGGIPCTSASASGS